MKTKMTALDVKASIEEMQALLIGKRLANVYDIGTKFFILKFGHGDDKRTVLIESGIRVHLTSLIREKPKMPSQFTFKLRKHIRSWRLDSVFQLAGDRTVVMRFGSEQTCFYFIVELYGKGNIILADQSRMVLNLLRTQRDGDVKLAVGSEYAMTMHTQPNSSDAPSGVVAVDTAVALQQFTAHCDAAHAQQSLKQTLTTFDNFGPQLAEHTMVTSNIAPDAKISVIREDADQWKALLAAVVATWSILYGALQPGGFLVPKDLKKKKQQSDNAAETDLPLKPTDVTSQQLQEIEYEDFSPVCLAQFSKSSIPVVQVPAFGEACDRFFFPSEKEKVDQHNEKKETVALAAKDRFFRDHNRRIGKLQDEEEENKRKGAMIQQNAESVQEVINLMNMLIAMKLAWDKISVLVKARQSEGHPVAYMIHDIHFDRNSVTVLLEEPLEEGEEDNEVEPLAVEIDLSMNAQRNAQRYFGLKKQIHQKLEKTLAATDKAAAGAEKKGARVAAKQGAQKKEIILQRRKWWFEKFLWFITSAGDLVVGGRDASQTDTLLWKYAKGTDVLVCSDAPKAFPFIVKQRDGSQRQIQLVSIQEAGAMCVSRSAAWDSKSSVSAWWAPASRVVKVEDGARSWVVNGEKNYLKPMPLTLACGLLFCADTPQPLPVVQNPVTVDLPEASPTPLLTAASEVVSISFPAPGDAVPPALLPNPSGNHPAKRSSQGLSVRGLGQRSMRSDGRQLSTELSDTSSIRTKETQESSNVPKGSPVASAAANTANSKRLKHKLKKIEKKYAEQDEEERETRMKLLGNKPSKAHAILSQKGKGKSSSSCSETDEEDGDEEDGGEPGNSSSRKQEAEPPLTASLLQQQREATAAVKPQQQPEPKPFERRKEADAKAEAVQCEKDMDEAHHELEYFTAAPSTSDAVRYCVVVCAPASTIQFYKYRVELSHGNEKKGAASNAVLHHFATAVAEQSNGIRAAVSHIDSESLQNQIVGNVKVHFQKATQSAARKIVNSDAISAPKVAKNIAQLHADPASE